MKKFCFLLMFLSVCSLLSQNLHDDANAASILNEANATTGWNGNGNITSTADNPFSGNFAVSIAATTTNGSGKEGNYAFNAIVGETYQISIWARLGPTSFQPAFANWFGLNGFATTLVTTANWTEYTWTVVATNANPIIRIYAAPWSGAEVGNSVVIDNVSILLVDNENPSVPLGLNATNLGETGVTINWTAATDNIGVVDYEVFQDGQSVGFSGGGLSFDVTGLNSDTSYDFTVVAVDGFGNSSAESAVLQITTLSPTDTEAPSVPTGLNTTNLTETGVTLNWLASTDNVGVVDYEVFQDGNSLGFTGGTLTFDITGLTAATSYNFTVTALDAATNASLLSAPLEVTTLAPPDTEAPSVPTGLNATNLTETGVTLNWLASTDNVGVVDYEVFQDGNSLGFSGGTLTFDITGLTAATSYNFTVTALDAATNASLPSAPLEVTTLTPPDTEAPSVPTGLNAINLTETGVTLNWLASTDNVDVVDYEVFQDGNSLGFSGGALTFDITGLTAATSYNFTVTALDAATNVSLPSTALEVTTLTPPDTEAPSAPTGLNATNLTETGFILNWLASTDNVGVVDYEVFQDGNSLGFSGGTLTFDITGLTAATTYNFTVTALDAATNVSLPSTALEVTTLTPPPDEEAPSVPLGLNATNITQTGATLNWQASTDNVGVVDYQIFQDGNLIGTSGGALTLGVTGLSSDTTYSFTVSAVDAASNVSAQSTALPVTTLNAPDIEAPSIPTGLSATNVSDTGVTLNWEASTDNVGVVDYEVFQDGVSIGLSEGALSFGIIGLTPETTYDFTVSAIDASDNASNQSAILQVTTLSPPDTEAPSIPTGLSATNVSDTGVTLNWEASTDNVGVVDYEVFQDGVSIGLSEGALSFGIIGLTPETTYDFTMSAIDASDNASNQSAILQVTTLSPPDTEAPSIPTGLSATNVSDTGLTLNWLASTDNVGVVDYEVFQDGVSIGLSEGALSFGITGLTPETTYDFTVSAIDASDNASNQSPILQVNTLSPPDTEAPTIPTGLSATNVSDTGLTLNWLASTDNVGVVDYEVFQNGVSIGLSEGALSFGIIGLTPETTYDFTVSAIDASDNASNQSAILQVTTLSPPDTEAPSIPTGLSATNVSDTGLTLNWEASTDNVGVVDYEVFQNGQSIGFSAGALTFNVSGLSGNTTYNFNLTAIDASDNVSNQSAVLQVTTLVPPDTEAPSVPTGLLATNVTDTALILNWGASTDNVGVVDYEIFQDGQSIGFSAGVITFVVTGLTAETSYGFSVAAIDAADNSSNPSTVLNVTTTSGIVDYTSINANLDTVDWTGRDLFATRNIGIGTTNTQGYRLAVAGNMIAEEVRVALQASWPDYVFDSSYRLPSLLEVETHIEENGHLINVPSASEVEQQGIGLGEMNAILLQKIEELTLYIIQQEKRIQELEKTVKRFEN
ncbi:fibronectin type III domain-containing protein [Mangrovimonas sp. YM274]|uniref:fibronectin type III domain-containing protein n=1 Tax=Mangrovimonas sp. YM274 TaxID=3070660 RepID=UPI0027DB5FA4|nr:fibronectin type III domain-containing protein [Mangrovimonas sp. YM274]WMI68290.1 fibronectin type III domain-containing protein [Mangrovimonas sp. YM274]